MRYEVLNDIITVSQSEATQLWKDSARYEVWMSARVLNPLNGSTYNCGGRPSLQTTAEGAYYLRLRDNNGQTHCVELTSIQTVSVEYILVRGS